MTEAQAPPVLSNPPRAARLGASLARAAAFAGFASAAHVALLVRTRYLKGEFSWASRDMLWMSPVANIVILCGLAIATWAVARAVARGRGQAIVDGVLAGFTALAVLLLIGGLHEIAVAVLSVGVGVQVGRWSASGARVVRWSTVVGLGVLGIMLAAGAAERFTRDRRLSAGARQDAPQGAPNVLVIIWDTVRAASVGLYGAERPTTPELEAFAATATTFDWAMAPSPWTLPSHCSMFTGLQPGEHSCRWGVPLRGEPMTIAEAFRARGWRTGAFVANPFYTSWESGLGYGFERYNEIRVSVRQVLLSSTLSQTGIARDLFRGSTWRERTRALRSFKLRGDPKPLTDRKLAAQVNDEFLGWLDRGDARPFFAFLNLFDAHDPYDPPAPWDAKFPQAPKRLGLYEGGVAYMDSELGRLTRALAQRGLLDNTIIVVTSDHGEMFGEHGMTNHGHALYMPLIHVPLVVRAPGLPTGQRVSSVVGLRDLAATLAQLAGLGSVPGIGGSSFATADRLQPSPVGDSTVARVALSEVEKSQLFWMKGPARLGAMHALTDDSLHYIVDATGAEELFAYRSDRSESENLASRDSTQLRRFRALLPRMARALVR
ncbi:MAG: sulfatase [Gemmatimonadaceae bacterium]|nr:sulfatase [Gemmatimonadaceae bacterium]